MKSCVFFSDVHLGNLGDPKVGWLSTLLQQWRREGVTKIFILGDLFDWWVHPRQGQEGEVRKLFQRFQEVQRRGVEIFFVPGNRDFLATSYLQKRWGWHNLGWASQMCIQGVPLYLTHGHHLFSSQRREQIFQRIIESPFVSTLARVVPYGWSKWVAQRLRRASRGGNDHFAFPIFPILQKVGPVLVKNMFPARVAIVGHLHQELLLCVQRDGWDCWIICLGEWKDEPTYLKLQGNCFTFYPSGREFRVSLPAITLRGA